MTLRKMIAKLTVLAAATCWMVVQSPAGAAGDIFMRPDGITGDATQEEHVDWVVVESLSEGFGVGLGSVSGTPDPTQLGDLLFSGFVITKFLDSSSLPFRQILLTKTQIPAVEIHFVTTGSPGVTFYEILLTDVFVTQMSLSSGGDLPVESITLEASTITWTFISDAGTGARISFGFDRVAERPL